MLSHSGPFDTSRENKALKTSKEFNTILLNCEDGVGSLAVGSLAVCLPEGEPVGEQNYT